MTLELSRDFAKSHHTCTTDMIKVNGFNTQKRQGRGANNECKDLRTASNFAQEAGQPKKHVLTAWLCWRSVGCLLRACLRPEWAESMSFQQQGQQQQQQTTTPKAPKLFPEIL